MENNLIYSVIDYASRDLNSIKMINECYLKVNIADKVYNISENISNPFDSKDSKSKLILYYYNTELEEVSSEDSPEIYHKLKSKLFELIKKYTDYIKFSLEEDLTIKSVNHITDINNIFDEN